jgi:transposase
MSERWERIPTSSTTDGSAMLSSLRYSSPSDIDLLVFDKLVPKDHYLRQVMALIDFQSLRAIMEPCYSPDQGRPALEPLLLLKLEFLQFHYNLSDREVIAQAQVNVAFRFFLGLSLDSALPVPSLFTIFRQRLGAERHQQLFDAVVAQARRHGLVKDRLRLKDATHVIANIAIPSAITLVAQTREKLAAAIEPFQPVVVAAWREKAASIRTMTEDLSDDERLLQRVVHLREIVAWVDSWVAGQSGDPAEAAWQRVLAAQELAHRVLADRDDPEKGDQTRSVHDPDARRGRHGIWYDGYLMDVAMDADSELVTAMNVLPANGDEAADAEYLIVHEETTHGNDVTALSMDGAGFQGELLRDLQDSQGLGLDFYTPPKAEPATPYFTPQEFQHDLEQGTLTCPAGQQAKYRQRETASASWIFRFDRDTCAGCPLQGRCLKELPKTMGRTVRKSDYEAEHQAARAKAATEEFRAVRREHPKIERKLSELVRWHGARVARYRGIAKLFAQELMTGIVVNVKRIVRLLNAPGLVGVAQ